MEVSIDDLKKQYETLDTYELLALKENGGLTETALSVLEQELSKRKPPEEESEKILWDLPKREPGKRGPMACLLFN